GMTAPAHRGLVDRGAKAPRRQCGQRPDITRPGDVDEFSRRPLHADKLDVAAEAGKRPVERASEPWNAVLFTGQCGAGPLVGAVEEPDAGKAEHCRDGANLLYIGRLRTGQ